MKADWEICPRDDVRPQYAGIYVTMNPKGDIVLSRVTHEMLGAPKAFLLMFDRTNRRIGLKPTQPAMRHAYPVRVSNRAGGKKIHAHRLTREYNIDLPQTVRFYDARIEDGLLILDLRTARISPRSAGHHRNRGKSASEMG